MHIETALKACPSHHSILMTLCFPVKHIMSCWPDSAWGYESYPERLFKCSFTDGALFQLQH